MEPIKLKSVSFPQVRNIEGCAEQTFRVNDRKVKDLTFFPDRRWVVIEIEGRDPSMVSFDSDVIITERIKIEEKMIPEPLPVHPKISNTLMGKQTPQSPNPDIVAKLEATRQVTNFSIPHPANQEKIDAELEAKKPLPHFGSLHSIEKAAARLIHENAEKEEKPKKKKKRGRPRKK